MYYCWSSIGIRVRIIAIDLEMLYLIVTTIIFILMISRLTTFWKVFFFTFAMIDRVDHKGLFNAILFTNVRENIHTTSTCEQQDGKQIGYDSNKFHLGKSMTFIMIIKFKKAIILGLFPLILSQTSNQ